ncbi:DUF6788 family protein [Paraburkholderia youngii]|uniref:DUF6788 family protein n=1 Tax=Paraburkholderia youngii TaxID=2782701 RepID=UPI003D1F15EF
MPALETLLHGSLIERYKRCRKPGCRCADGPGHGPKYYLSVSFPGRRPQMDDVPQADYTDVAEHLANYHRVREIIEEICEINRELLRRREALLEAPVSQSSLSLANFIDPQSAGVLVANMLEAWLTARACAGADRGGLR